MTIQVDGSSPAGVRGATTTTSTAAFSPPGAALLVAFVEADANNGNAGEQCTVSSTGGLSWFRHDLGNGAPGSTAEVWWAVTVAAPGSITVSVTDNQGAVDKSLYVRVFTDTNGGTPGIGASAISATTTTSYVSTVANSTGWCTGIGAAGAPVAGSGQTVQDSAASFDGGDATWTVSQDAVTATAGTTVNNGTTNATVTHQVAVEIVPGALVNVPPPMTLPQHVLYQFLQAAWARRQFVDDGGVQVTADVGSAPLGLTATTTAVKIANVAGTCSMGLAGAGTARKTALPAGTAATGLAATGAAARKALPTGAATLGLTAAGRAAHAQAATAAMGLAATGAARKTAAPTGRAPLGLSATGAAARKALPAGTATIGLTSHGTQTTSTTRAQTGTCAIGLAATGAARRTALPAGRSAAGLTSTSTAARKAPLAGRAALGLAAAGLATKRAASAGSTAVGLAARGAETTSAGRAQTGVASLGLAAAAVAGKLVPPPPAPPGGPGGWYQLLAITKERTVGGRAIVEDAFDIHLHDPDYPPPTSRPIIQPVPAACPHDGQPLRQAEDGTLFCPFDGYQYPRDRDPGATYG